RAARMHHVPLEDSGAVYSITARGSEAVRPRREPRIRLSRKPGLVIPQELCRDFEAVLGTVRSKCRLVERLRVRRAAANVDPVASGSRSGRTTMFINDGHPRSSVKQGRFVASAISHVPDPGVDDL